MSEAPKALPEWRIDDVSQASMALWCELLRDDNPIHLDPAAADALGFGPHTVNPGPANLAYVINMLMTARPDAEIAEIEARFLGNVRSGDAVLAQGTVEAGDPARCKAELVLPDGTPLLAAEVQLRPREG